MLFNNSFQLLTKLGLDSSFIKKTVDPVFSFRPQTLKRDQMLNQLRDKFANKCSRVIGVSVRPWKNNGYLHQLADVLNYFGKKFKAEVLILPFHYYQDREISKNLQSLLDRPSSLINQRLTFEEMITIFSKLDLLVGVRLHSLIFAALNNIPLVAISYDPKIEAFLQSLGLSEPISEPISIAECSFDQLQLYLEQVWANQEQIVNKLKVKNSKFHQIAHKNAAWVLELLN